jgi:hypothetical protein
MKSKEWILWLLAGVCFSFVGIMSLIENEYLRGITFIILGVFYFALSRTKYKGNNKSTQMEVSATDLENMNIELRKIIAQGEKIKAIKKCRMVTGLGLKEAKEYVDLLK